MKKIGIYIHIPFCKKKCKYCDFISFSNTENLEEYVKSLISEINNVDRKIEYINKCSKSGKLNLKEFSINTIYFGGGTPSYINEKYIEKILLSIKEKFKVDQNAEITLEVNPGTVDENKFKKYKEIGINRLSVGLQSSNDNLLKTIGRIHNYNEFLETYNKAKQIGFDNVNVDLMLALPNQTEQDLIESLINIINLKVNHISLYSLIIEENTELEKEVKLGKLKEIDENIERKMYWKAKKILEKNGYFQYEISNYSKKSQESKHNLNCWNQECYLGFGLAAHSYFNDVRFSNIIDLKEYIANMEKEKIIQNIEIQEIQEKPEKMKEFMMIGLRKIEGISISEFERRFEINPLFYFRFEIEELTNKELIEVDLDNIKLTEKGLDLANIVFEKFV